MFAMKFLVSWIRWKFRELPNLSIAFVYFLLFSLSRKKKVLLAGLVAACSAGLIPAAVPAAVPAAFAAAPVPAALTVGTYATSYNAHAVNHAVAAPYIASPVIAHAAPLAYSSLPAAALVAGRRWEFSGVTIRGQSVRGKHPVTFRTVRSTLAMPANFHHQWGSTWIDLSFILQQWMPITFPPCFPLVLSLSFLLLFSRYHECWSMNFSPFLFAKKKKEEKETNKKDLYQSYFISLHFILAKLTIRNICVSISIVCVGREKEGEREGGREGRGEKERRTRSWRDKRSARQKIPRQPGNKRQLVDFVADFFSWSYVRSGQTLCFRLISRVL